MAENRWDKVGALLEEARERPPDERAAFLEEACDETSVREEVLSLLEAEAQEQGFFEDLAAALPTSADEAPGEEQGLRVSDPLDLEGTTVGRYEVEAHLGGGGMGVVYKARDPELDRQVALKFLPPHLATSLEAEKRFVREARAASALEHPHIATIYEIGTSEAGDRFIAMAYYEGETLKEKLDREERLPVEDAVRYAEQIAAALARAHEAGIVHRDVKPANVMVTETGEVKLLDFGLAKAAAETRLTEPGRQLGTTAYMSPEQAEGAEVGPPTDLWALGIVLYEMLTRTLPFRGERNTALLRAILHDNPTPLDEQRDDLPVALVRIVNRCLQKDFSDRYPSAVVLFEDLRALRQEPNASKDSPTQEQRVRNSAGEDPPANLLDHAQWIIQELRRRRVLRVAAVYAGTAFVLLQLGEILVPPFGLPPWTLRLITLVLILGFPLAVGLAWIFDVTEEGLVRDRGKTVSAEEQPLEQRSLASDLGILALFVVGVVGLGWIGLKTWLGPPVPGSSTAGVDGVASPQEVSQPAKSGEQASNLDPAKVAVLYFEDNSPGDTLTAFANGFTEHLIHRLAQVEGLDVVSQHGVEPYRKASPPLDSIAQRLGAGSLIKGSVRPVGTSLSVYVRLIDGETQSTLMSEMIRRPAVEVFALQDDLAQEVSGLLRKHLGQQVQLESWQAETQSAEAWRLVQRADRLREDARLREQNDQVELALDLAAQTDSLLAKAEAIDPNWSAPAALRARLTPIRVDPYAERWDERDRELAREGIEHATDALGRDPTDTEARTIRGRLRFWLSRRVSDPDRSQTLMDGAENDLRRAIRESTGAAQAMYTLSRLLIEGRGDFSQALYYAERARKADAYLRFPSDTRYQLFYAALNVGQYEDAARWCHTGQRRYPDLVQFRNCELVLLATVGAAAPDVDRAWELVKEIRARTEPEKRAYHESVSRPKVAAVLARAGHPDSARAVLRRTRHNSLGTHPASSYNQAHAYLLLGEEEQALKLLSRAVKQSPQFAPAPNDPWWESLRDHPRFQKMVAR